jgi:hypothetical protein
MTELMYVMMIQAIKINRKLYCLRRAFEECSLSLETCAGVVAVAGGDSGWWWSGR